MLVAHGIEAQRQQAPGNSYPRDGLSVSSTSSHDPRVQSTKTRIAFGCHRSFDQGPAQPPRALLGDSPAAHVVSTGSFFGRESCPGAEMVGAWEARKVADLGHDGRRRE